jgi:hypothetical protein
VPPLRTLTSGPGAPLTAEGTPDEHEDQDEYSGDREDDAQTRDIAPEVRWDVGERYAGDIYEGGCHGCSQERQDYRDHQGQQEAVLSTGATRHVPCDVASHEKRQKEGY